jgi:hypothetical protein
LKKILILATWEIVRKDSLGDTAVIIALRVISEELDMKNFQWEKYDL